jgi:hypothetical protein
MLNAFDDAAHKRDVPIKVAGRMANDGVKFSSAAGVW